jgi:hypothetical protein
MHAVSRLVTLALALAAPAANAAQITFASPSGDRWMYPFNGAPGTRPNGPTFGAPGVPSFDDRDAQVLVQFDTSGLIPSGAGPSSYTISSARLTMQLQTGVAEYDPSYDLQTTYAGLDEDEDAGRPFELYGAGYRSGFTTLTFAETSPFASGSPVAENVRNAYANDFAGGVTRDVSNNVALGFDPTPFALGAVSGVLPGGAVPDGSIVTFDLALTPDVVAYLQGRLDVGRVDLMLSSLHAAAQGGPITYPVWWLKEGGAATAPALTLDVQVVPEPAAGALAALGLAFVAAGRRLLR